MSKIETEVTSSFEFNRPNLSKRPSSLKKGGVLANAIRTPKPSDHGSFLIHKKITLIDQNDKELKEILGLQSGRKAGNVSIKNGKQPYAVFGT